MYEVAGYLAALAHTNAALAIELSKKSKESSKAANYCYTPKIPSDNLPTNSQSPSQFTKYIFKLAIL